MDDREEEHGVHGCCGHGGCEHEEEEQSPRVKVIRIVAAILAVVVLCLLPMWGVALDAWVSRALFLLPLLCVGYDIFREVGEGIVQGKLLDENFLMSVASIGAFAMGECAEGVAVLTFYQIGELFEGYADRKSRRNIVSLMKIRPERATVERGDQTGTCEPSQVEVGSVIVVNPGERIPLDGVVVSGTSTLHTAALTGESLPRRVECGDAVISGCVNGEGVLRIRTTKTFGESTVSRILELVEHASERKARSERFITRFARVYTPLVCLAAVAVAVGVPLVRDALGMEMEWGVWVYRSLTFLVISCPCAVVLSVPLTFFGAIGGAGARGILIKGANHLETLAEVKTVVFDKTGTLTKGNFEVVAQHPSTFPPEEVLRSAALAESHSSHPISHSLRREHEKSGGDLSAGKGGVTGVRETGGEGVEATVEGRAVAVGNSKLMERLNIPFRNCHLTGTVVHVAVDSQYAGHIVIADEIKPGAKDAVEAVKEIGVKRTVLLTGDRTETARAVAKEIGLDEVYAELLPDGKVARLEQLLADRTGGRVAFVGDGINDAPVLMRADLGIAMGALGSDAAVEAADVVLMDDDPGKVALAIRLAQRCRRIVWQNIVLALGVKFACMVLGTLGVGGLWLAVFADVGVLILCVCNALRTLMVR